MLHEEQDEENEEATLGVASESEISDAEDLGSTGSGWSCGCVLKPALLNE